MGSGVSSGGNENDGSRTQTFTNPNNNSQKEETVTIQITSDVVERVEAEMQSTMIRKSDNENAGPLQNETVGKTDGTYYHPVSNPASINKDLKSEGPVGDIKMAQGIKKSVPVSKIDNKIRELESEREQNFGRVIDTVKQSLQELADVLPHEKVVLGIGSDGRPTLETVGAWKVRQEKEEELRQNDLYWMDQLEVLKKDYIGSVLQDVDSFLERTEKINQICPPPKKNPCASLCSKVANCYATNKNEVLKCQSVVQEFSHCVQRSVDE